MKKKLIIISLLVIAIAIVCFQKMNNKPPKLNNITSIRVEYNQSIANKLLLVSPLEIKDAEQIEKLTDCFNVKSYYEIGCDCPSHDIIIHFMTDKKEYIYNIGITGDARIQYSEVPDEDISGININDIISVLNKNEGSENLKYPYE